MSQLDFSQEQIDGRVRKLEEFDRGPLGAAWHLVSRFFIRTLRIAAGTVLLGFALWSVSAAWDKLSTPFAAQSFLGIIAGLFLAWLAFFLVTSAFAAAFGAAPTPQEVSDRRTMRAIEELRAASWQADTEMRDRAQRQWVEQRARSAGRWFSQLRK